MKSLATYFTGVLVVLIGLALAAPAGLSAAPGDGNKSGTPDKTESGKTGTEGKKVRDKGLMKEFRRLEEKLRGRKRTAAHLKKTLETNLIGALSRSIVRRFYPERRVLLKNLKPANITYDNPTSPLVYYVRYIVGSKTLLARMDFARDPEYYLQYPVNVKLLADGKLPKPRHDAPPTSEKKAK